MHHDVSLNLGKSSLKDTQNLFISARNTKQIKDVIKIKLFAYPNYRQILSIYLGILILAYIFFSVIIGLQIYITARVLIPWLLPSITLWNYIRFGLKDRLKQ